MILPFKQEVACGLGTAKQKGELGACLISTTAEYGSLAASVILGDDPGVPIPAPSDHILCQIIWSDSLYKVHAMLSCDGRAGMGKL